MTDITAIILTKNEEVNIKRCIQSIKGIVDRICVVDSGSTDKTIEIAESMGAEIFYHIPFINYAEQFNWAVDNIDLTTTWVYRIDADECVTSELATEIVEQCEAHRSDDCAFTTASSPNSARSTRARSPRGAATPSSGSRSCSNGSGSCA